MGTFGYFLQTKCVGFYENVSFGFLVCAEKQSFDEFFVF